MVGQHRRDAGIGCIKDPIIFLKRALWVVTQALHSIRRFRPCAMQINALFAQHVTSAHAHAQHGFKVNLAY